MNRIKWLRRLMFLVVGVIGVRLFQIQIIEHEMWVAKATEAHTAEVRIPAERGGIYMMDGREPVAVVLNNTVYTVIVDPMVAKREKVEETIGGLAGNYLTAKWEDVFKNKGIRYYIVAKGVPHAQAVKIKEAGLAGVWFKEGNSRVYPEGQMAAQLLGFVNADGLGQYGVEGALNKRLAGKDGMMKSIVDVNNVALSIGGENVRVAAEDGEDVVLTIDKNIQVGVEEILTKFTAAHGASARAAAVVMDPTDGRVMAMVNVPTYDPANYGKVKDASAYVNYTTEVPYEPASMCKTFAFAAGIDTGVMNAKSTYYNSGSVTVDGFRILNAARNQPHGVITMQTGLNYSLNTSSVQALMWLSGGDGKQITKAGREKLYSYYYDKFGLGQYTGIEVLENPGVIVKPDAERYGIDLTYANMTFGQGLNLTMMQVAAGFSALVNGGVYHTPTMVYGYYKDGELVAEDTAKERNAREGERVVSEGTSAAMREMLWGGRNLMRLTGVDRGGYYVGGKSGTAQKIMDDGSYSDAKTGETIAGYIGFGGANGEEPAYVAMIKLWGDGLRFEGTGDARPVWNEVSNFLLDYLQIKPSS